MKKRTRLYLLAFLALLLLSGCKAADRRERVTVAFWSDQLTERYGQYLCETFPEVEFEFYVATNSTDFYRFKEARGDLPDILTVRRFSLNDVSGWRDALMDLSDSELVNAFHHAYLRSYTYSDGTVNWLPACAEIDGLLANPALFEANGLRLPTNYQEFAEACTVLRERGVRPFQSNFGADYTCMELLQGLSVERMTSQEGREWRQLYESGQTDQLSVEVWLPVFQRLAEFIELAGIGPEDLDTSTGGVFDAYRQNKTAMIRGTSGEASAYGAEDRAVMLPYFGTVEENNWYLTYPAFQVAASARAAENPEREQLVFDIMEAMLNQEGLRRIATGQDMIPYHHDTELELSPVLTGLQPYVDRNQLYIRLASSDMFAASKTVVQGMITGEYPNAWSAFEAFNQAMRVQDGEAAIAAHIDQAYSYQFRPDGGSPAASAVMNSLREELGTELLVGQAVNVAGNISAGDYTEAELRFLTMGESVDILLCEATGEQIYQYLSEVLTLSGKRGSVCGDSALYVSSGFEMELRRTEDGYAVERLTSGGGALDRNRTYRLAVLGNELLMQKGALASAGITDYEKADADYKQMIADRLMAGTQLAGPTHYITLR